MNTSEHTRRFFLPLVFALATLPLSLTLLSLLPVSQIPDAYAHLIRADSLSRGIIMGWIEEAPRSDGRVQQVRGALMDRGLAQMLAELDPEKKLGAQDFDRAKAQTWAGPAFYSTGAIATYFPTFYVPAALTLGVGREIGLSPYQAVFAVRVVNLLCFTALGMLALLYAPRGQGVIFCTLAVPISVFLASSVNPDGLMIVSATLAAALMARNAVKERASASHVLPARVAVSALLICAVALAKPPYVPLAALLILPFPWSRAGFFGSAFAVRLGLIAAIVAATAAWVATVAHIATIPLLDATYEAGPLWPGPRPAFFAALDPSAQMKVLLAEPLRLLTIPLNTFIFERGLQRQMIGMLGWVNTPLPVIVYTLWTCALGAALVSDATRQQPPAKPWGPHLTESALLFLAVLMALCAIYLSHYVTWTRVGAPLTEGTQGRYFLPLLPMLAVAVPLMGGGWTRLPARVLLAAPLVVAALDILVIPGAVTRAFYLQ